MWNVLSVASPWIHDLIVHEGSGSVVAVVRILAYLEDAWRALRQAARGGAVGGSVSEAREEVINGLQQ